MTSNGSIKQIFPLPSQQSIIGSQFPIQSSNGNYLGAILPDSISVDQSGRILTFSYAPKVSRWDEYMTDEYGYADGADIYAIDLSQIINNPNYDPALLPVSRLTNQSAIMSNAMNPGFASMGNNPANVGLYNIGGVLSMTSSGPKFFFLSNALRVLNSNLAMSKSNLQSLSVFMGDLKQTGSSFSLQNIRQALPQFTTNSIGLSRAFDGIFFSYQANISDARGWHIHNFLSNGDNYTVPAYGYGRAQNGAHESTACVAEGLPGVANGNYLVTVDYYNSNNQGMGHAVMVPETSFGQNVLLSDLGTQVPVSDGTGHKVYTQVGVRSLTPGVQASDYPSTQGKVGKPTCGEPNNIYYHYVPSPGNHNYSGFNYFGWIVHSDLIPRSPGVNAVNYGTVIKDAGSRWAAFVPVPIMSWSKRMKGIEDPSFVQRTSEPEIDRGSNYARGMPIGRLGSGSLHVTDITSYECRTNSTDPIVMPYHMYPGTNPPNVFSHENENWRYKVVDNTADLTIVPDPAAPCRPLLPSEVFGVGIYLTSHKTNMAAHETNGSAAGYFNTEPGYTQFEARKLIGVASVVNNPVGDTSWKAYVPAGQALDFVLYDRRWGAKLTEGLGWHVSTAGMFTKSCGGCHAHEPGTGVDWNTTHASQPETPTVDMVNGTQFIDYDSSCRPILTSATSAAEKVPTWGNIKNFFNTSCGQCHLNTSTDPYKATDINSFTYTSANLSEYGSSGLVAKLRNRGYLGRGFLDSLVGAAFAGQRLDRRVNSRYASGPLKQFYFSDVHTPNHPSNIGPTGRGFCSGEPEVAEAARNVRKVVEWLDEGAPINTGAENATFSYGFDFYPPSLDFSFTNDDCSPGPLRVGFWDDSSNISISGLINGASLQLSGTNNLRNGSFITPLPSLNSEDLIEITAVDNVGNRKIVRKTVAEIQVECLGNGNNTNTNPNPSSSPSPSPSGTPTASPTPSQLRTSLFLDRNSAQPGGRVNFRILSTENGEYRIFGTTTGTIPGQDYGNAPIVHIDLNPSAVFDRTSGWTRHSLKQGDNKFSLRIPRKFRRYNMEFNFQVLAKNGNGIAISNTVSFSIKPGTGSKLSKKGKKQETLFKKLKIQKNKLIKKNYKIPANSAAASKIKSKLKLAFYKLEPFILGKSFFKAAKDT